MQWVLSNHQSPWIPDKTQTKTKVIVWSCRLMKQTRWSIKWRRLLLLCLVFYFILFYLVWFYLKSVLNFLIHISVSSHWVFIADVCISAAAKCFQVVLEYFFPFLSFPKSTLIVLLSSTCRYSPKDPSMASETVHYKRGVSQQFSMPSFKIDFSEWKEEDVSICSS